MREELSLALVPVVYEVVNSLVSNDARSVFILALSMALVLLIPKDG